MTDRDELRSALDDFFSRVPWDDHSRSTETSGMDPSLWNQVEELGFPFIGLPEEAGGSGGSTDDLLVLLQMTGHYAVPLPVAETALAGWITAASGATLEPGAATIVPGSPKDTLRIDGGRLYGTAHAVPWARDARRIVTILPDSAGALVAVTLDPTTVSLRQGRDLAGLPSDTIEADGVDVVTRPWPESLEAVGLRGGLYRSAQLVGALDTVLEITLRYLQEREQFGKPIGAFQSVQMHLVTVAQAAALSSSAVQQAALELGSPHGDSALRRAKLVVSQEATKSFRATHQAHGAIGLTKEYRLQLFTRRLDQWRGEFGSEHELGQRLGDEVLAGGSLRRLIFGA
jgi:acyl-CoA dehydrogenase